MTASRLLLRRLSAVVLLAVGLVLMAGLATVGFLKARTVEAQIETKRGQLQALLQRASGLAQAVADKRKCIADKESSDSNAIFGAGGALLSLALAHPTKVFGQL